MRDELEVLRDEIALCNLDLTRGAIEAEGAGFVVRLDPPQVDIAAHIEGSVPTVIHCSSAYQAECEMLRWLRRIQQAERKQVRMGRWFEGTSELMKRPLDPSEVEDYLAELSHRRQHAKLRDELSAALQRQREQRDARAGAAELAKRYPGRLESASEQRRGTGRTRKAGTRPQTTEE